MKCMLCSNTIDELKEFPVVEKIRDGRVEKTYDEAGQRNHAEALSTWSQLVVSTGALSERHILQGHICPTCAKADLTKVQLSMPSTGGKVAA